ncbi:KCNJN [Lepeophtheirus salmonis]|uniref:KCNJN n=1 Tax=Lepeophtheirus salmonis TaxID=72036 RepID=A0A7R8CF90_LEPSM|nr:KCNJN [Lepeophtheirus salmonis]CAF2804123.1 KCNJN [Lepeophtheirus salmonis]
MIQACMVGTIFAKLSRPKKRAQTLLFSRNAVVSSKDGYLCLQFRVGNMRNSHLVESHARAILISKRVTSEGEVIPYHQTDLKVGSDMEESPFYNMSARDFIKKRFEVIVVLEGIVEPTGMSIQARSSYLPPEILWGHRFQNVLTFKESEGSYIIDYSSFNSVYKVETPPHSAKHLDEEKKTEAEAKGKRESSSWSLPASNPRGAAGLIAKYKLQANHISVPCLPQYRKIVPSSSSNSVHEGAKTNLNSRTSSITSSLNANVERFF